MPELQVLVVDDEPAVRQVMAAAIGKAGYTVDSAASAQEALNRLDQTPYDVVLSDVFMPVMDGIELLRRARERGHAATFIMVTAFSSVDSAIDAIKAGAWDYITKPVRREEIVHRLEQIEAMRGLREENRALRSMVLVGGAAGQPYTFQAQAMLATERLISRVAPTDSTVLVTGESGTGKGVTARRLHELSARREGPFVPVNCAAIPDNLLESELFGHTKGAFTSADKARRGLFVQADHGTLFLDEIGELPLGLQTKLLHVLEAKEVRPLGAEQSRKVDVRIVAATNRDLPAMVEAGTFREDLFFRLSVFQIPMPPLRERRADLPALLRHLLAQRSQPSGARQVLGIDPEAEDLLLAYAWPGNLRQLENVLHRAAILADGDSITVADLAPEVVRAATLAGAVTSPGAAPATRPAEAGTGLDVADPPPEATLRERVRRFEIGLIRRAIDEAGGDRRLAAQRLGIGLSSLYRKLEEDERGDKADRLRKDEDDPRAALIGERPVLARD
ncbi:sigma-54-dependent transcriptional regulator [Sphaerotilus mobilis]|uniref:Two component Fis family sigma54 specific transcriptional regulator n=1 Tax=Sphaerotilus mobilis TaxID=47994 RepID=A0A4Q7LUE0_9BURK|nr:sigma-54 dependent transcriptional regulator [Sphaerotilus mobilis]RZS58141.1 two component Fis family sigma54 specific transcriptional regulator [Sphaerotilus mobilis]